VSYRVEFGGRAQVQFHSLPERARDALIERAAELAAQLWDAVVRPPRDDPRFREAVFGIGSGIPGFYLDEDAQLCADRHIHSWSRPWLADPSIRPG
jgi:hypothetical protein